MELPDHHELEKLALELSFSTNKKAIASAYETISELDDVLTSIEKDEISQNNSVGSFSDDRYNAILDRYDNPRSEKDHGPLSGFTFAVKDNISVKDLKMTCGVTDFSYVPSLDAVVVERLLEAGAELVGKTNMEPFAFGQTGEQSEFGPVTNPIAENRICGGSSSGSGAAVAGELVDFALGTDTGGSVRAPAACCNLVGLKPSNGIVPRHGFVDMVPWTDTIGVVAPDVQTAGNVLDVMIGPNRRAPASSPIEVDSVNVLGKSDGGLTIGIPESLLRKSGEQVTTVMEELQRKLDNDPKVTLRTVSLNISDISELYPLMFSDFAWLVKQCGIIHGEGTSYNEEFRKAFEEFVEHHNFNEYVTSRVLPAAYVDENTNGQVYVALRNEVTEFRTRLDDLFTEIDLLLTPTMRTVPPELGTVGVYEGSLNIMGNTVPFSLANTPAVSVPVQKIDGLPVSAQIVAPQYEDHTALLGAKLIEELSD